MTDLAFVLLTLAAFATIAVVARRIERGTQ